MDKVEINLQLFKKLEYEGENPNQLKVGVLFFIMGYLKQGIKGDNLTFQEVKDLVKAYEVYSDELDLMIWK